MRLRPRGVVLVALGPCTLLAPVVFVVAILAMLCWPFVLAALALVWGATWPVEWVLVSLGVSRARGLRVATGRVLSLVARPWSYFEVPARPEPAVADSPTAPESPPPPPPDGTA